MVDVERHIMDGEYTDSSGVTWTRKESLGYEKIYWLKGDTGVSYTHSQFRDKVIEDRIRVEQQAQTLERAGLSGLFGTTAQNALLNMATMLRKGTLKEFLDENGCQW